MSKRIITGVLAIAAWGYSQVIPYMLRPTQVGKVSLGQTTTYSGYNAQNAQGAVLGSSTVEGDEDLLLLGNINSASNASGFVVVAVSKPDAPTYSKGSIDGNNFIGGMLVLRPLKGVDQSALVVFRTVANLLVYEIKIGATGTITATELKRNPLPTTQVMEGTQALYGRLALVSSSKVGGGLDYHVALSNPYYDHAGVDNVGRVDFVTLDDATWGLTQPNTAGLTSGSPSQMYALASMTEFGSAVTSAGDVDGDGVNDLAVLTRQSTSYTHSALFIVLMKDGNTPKDQRPVVWTGDKAPWREDPATIPDAVTDYKFIAKTLYSADLNQDGRPELLVGGMIPQKSMYSSMDLVRAFYVATDGSVERVERIASYQDGSPYSGIGYMGPLASWNYSSGAPTIWQTYGGGSGGATYSIVKTITHNTQLVRHYAIRANQTNRSKVVKLDSVFHRTAGEYTVKTLSGLVDCELNEAYLSCRAPAEAAKSWSRIEVQANKESCKAYSLCVEKDTFHIFTNTEDGITKVQWHLPTQVLANNAPALQLGVWQQWAYISDYPIWYGAYAKISSIEGPEGTPSLSATRESNGAYTLSPVAGATGINAINIQYKTNSTFPPPPPVPFHVVAPENLIEGAVPATPGQDTLFAAAEGQYYLLPAMSEAGNLYTYDIAQELGEKAEIIGQHLLVKTFDEGEALTIRYTENKEVKTRTLVLSTQAKVTPPEANLTTVAGRTLQLQALSHGVQVNGLQGAYQIRVVNAQGQVMQQLQGHAQGSLFVPLSHHGLNIVQVQNQGQSQYIQMAR